MKKNTTSATATTFTMDPALTTLDADDRADLSRPYTWPTVEAARVAVQQFQHQAEHGMYRVTEHAAPGLEVFAIYRTGRAFVGSEPEWVLMSVIEISDDTAATFHRAVRREFPVTVSYVKADGEETVRTIEPTSVQVTKTGALLVKALDRKSAEARSFRLDRVQAYTLHRSRRTVRTEAPAPTKAELWEAWTAHQREFVPARPVSPATGYDESQTPAWDAILAGSAEVVEVQSWTGVTKYISRAAYDKLLAARDPREPKAADEARPYLVGTVETSYTTDEVDVYDTTPGTAVALEAPEEIQDRLAEAYASGERYAFVTV
jgi:WYL domain-containing protein